MAGFEPKSTAVAPVKPVPVISTGMLLEVGPADGETAVTVGGFRTQVSVSPPPPTSPPNRTIWAVPAS